MNDHINFLNFRWKTSRDIRFIQFQIFQPPSSCQDEPLQLMLSASMLASLQQGRGRIRSVITGFSHPALQAVLWARLLEHNGDSWQYHKTPE
jgi:hypothetical protein